MEGRSEVLNQDLFASSWVGGPAGCVWSPSQDFSSPSASFVTVLGCQLHPSDGVARQRGSDVQGGLLICQTPADTWLKLLPAYPEEGRGTLPAYCRAPGPPEQEVQKATRRRGLLERSNPQTSPVPRPPFSPLGLLLAPPCRSPPHSIPLPQTTEEQSAAGKKRSSG